MCVYVYVYIYTYTSYIYEPFGLIFQEHTLIRPPARPPSSHSSPHKHPDPGALPNPLIKQKPYPHIPATDSDPATRLTNGIPQLPSQASISYSSA